jgi:hypothetical protein
MVCKKEVEEDKPMAHEKRIHTEMTDKMYRVEKAKSKRMHSFMNQKRILRLTQEHSPAKNS